MKNSNTSWDIPFNNLAPSINTQRTEIEEAIGRVLDRQVFINGPEVEAFEKDLAFYCGVKYAISCANGTDAITLALMAAKIRDSVLGWKGRNKVVTVANSAPATVAAIKRAGLIPLYADIERNGLVNTHEMQDMVGDGDILAVLPVNLYGQVVNYNFAKIEYQFEDGAQSLGNKLFCQNDMDGWTTSFYPTKNLGALGDGGAFLTNNKDLANLVRQIKNYGLNSDKFMEMEGFNSRLDEIQAAILRIRLKYLDSSNEYRRNLVQLYDSALDKSVKHRTYNTWENYHLYTIRVPNGLREKLIQHLTNDRIQTMIHYPPSVPCWFLPKTVQFQKEILSLPLWPGMYSGEVLEVCHSINAFMEANKC